MYESRRYERHTIVTRRQRDPRANARRKIKPSRASPRANANSNEVLTSVVSERATKGGRPVDGLARSYYLYDDDDDVDDARRDGSRAKSVPYFRSMCWQPNDRAYRRERPFYPLYLLLYIQVAFRSSVTNESVPRCCAPRCWQLDGDSAQIDARALIY